MKKGHISVIMAAYNCADTLRESVDSILAQTYTDYKMIICDDCSADETNAILKEYEAKYPDKIKVIRNEKNSKLPASLNRCLEYADGEFIARMDGDDISVETRFEKQVAFLQEHPEYDMVGTAMRRFSDDGGMADIVYSIDNPDYYTLRTKIPFHHATIMARNYVYEKLKGYTVCERTVRCEDYDLWFRFFKEGFKGQNLREALYLVREDAAAIRRRNFKSRMNSLKTMWYGFNLLGYPKKWLIRPTVVSLLKAITPHKMTEMYRKWQASKK